MQCNARTAGMHVRVQDLYLDREKIVRMQAKRCSIQEEVGETRRGEGRCCEEVGAAATVGKFHSPTFPPARSFFPSFLCNCNNGFPSSLSLSLSLPHARTHTDTELILSLCFLSLYLSFCSLLLPTHPIFLLFLSTQQQQLAAGAGGLSLKCPIHTNC